MGQFRRQMYEEYSHEFSTDESFNLAYKKVKKIKGFYSHLRVYILVNIIIIVSSLNQSYIGDHFVIRGFRDWEIYSTAFFWGIALVIHGISVFGPDVFFNRDWEQKKIQKIMKKEAENKNKWK
ncbi:2TM domain-containing protein [Flavobacterium tructae]|uniref:2TM domain-containing protein n=1 Tax=Flavobacterium tructae TaxID=1114873 RepID=UPI002551FECC|nr:2TM domain-containing protein [Flavobacterium tructae]MDL2142984.1 2TM domain-containing protein [Flavobacterium tructae]